LVTTRIQTTRRLGASRHAPRRRRSAWPLLTTVANSAAAERLALTSFARAYLAAGGLLVLAIAYLVVSAQATQTSYQLDNLKSQNTQLLAEQDQLRYDDARMHTPAGVAAAAAAAGMQHTNLPHYAGYQPVAVNLDAPIGPARPADTPPWQRALAAIASGVAKDAQAAGR
jgi:cell division protein FtsL